MKNRDSRTEPDGIYGQIKVIKYFEVSLLHPVT